MNKKYGVGILDKKSVYNTKCYIVWNSMLARCYSNYRHTINKTYSDCTVCEEWHLYSNFEKWFNKHYKNGQQLDKDIMVPGNKIYSPSTCCFVPGAINTLIISKQTKMTKLPTGVSITENGSYQVIVKYHGKPKRVGTFKTIKEARKAYITYKKNYLKEVATEYFKNGEIDKIVYNAILHYEYKNEPTQ